MDQEEKELHSAEEEKKEDPEKKEEKASGEKPSGKDDSNKETPGSGDHDKKSGRDKKKKKEPKEDKKDEKIADLTDRLQRQMAEFDNFRKRTEKEKSQMFDTGAKSIIEKVLPVVDNFERALACVPEGQKEDPFVEGMEKVYKQMMKMFEEAGIEPIEAVGKQFDPNFHNAVMHVEDDQYDENVVVEEFQKGYTYHDSVVRHSMVKVAN